MKQVERIGVIGDVHAENSRLAAALEWLHGQQLDAIVCTGDVCDGPGDVDLCCDLLVQAEVQVVAGNHDRWMLQDRVRHIDNAHRAEDLDDASIDYLTQLPRTIELETCRGTMMLCHGVAENDLRKVWPGTERLPIERSAELDEIVADGEVGLVVNGHMHYRVLIDFDSLLLVNAGTLASRHRPGISIIDAGTGSVCAYEFAETRLGGVIAEHALDATPDRRVWRDTQEFDGNWRPVTLYGT